MTVKRHPARPDPADPGDGRFPGRRCLDCTGQVYRPTPSPDLWRHLLGYTLDAEPRSSEAPA